MKVEIKPSTSKGKKYTAVFYDSNNKKLKTTKFGSAGASDYTKHKDPDRKARYPDRHRASENWSNPQSAGVLSRWILWNQSTVQASVADYKKRFKR